MATVIVDISNKVVDAAIRKELKRLESQIKRLKESNQNLKSQIREQKFKVEEAQRIVAIALSIATEFGDDWGED